MSVTGVRDYAIVLLDAAGRVVGWNADAEGVKGYRAEEIMGRSFAVFYPPEDVALGEPARHLADAAAAGHVEYQGWRVRRDGSQFWADVVLTAFLDDAGVPSGYGKVTRDATARRNAEEALRDIAERHRLLLESTGGVAIVLLDRTGRVTGWDAAAERLKGYTSDEIVGRSFAVFYPPEEVQLGEPARHLADAAAVGQVKYEGWRMRKDGSRFWADVVLTALLDDAGALRGFGKVTGDATARRNAEQALRDTEDRHRLLVDNTRNFAVVLLGRTGEVVGWNAGAERIKGYAAQEIIGRSFVAFYPPEDVEHGEPARHLADAAAAGHAEYQGWRIRKDGSRFWADVVLTALFDDAGALRGFGKVTRDATERRDADQALRDSEERYRLLVDRVRDLAIVLLDEVGRVAGWNVGAERILGFTSEEVVGHSFAVFYPPEEVERGEPARHLAQAGAVGHAEYEGWRIRKDGSRFCATVVVDGVYDDRGALRGFRTATRDISERKALEAQLAQQALHDPLTGLANRTLLNERLEHALLKLRRHPGSLTLLFLDLDQFKLINDSLGHEAGDELLIQTGNLLRAAVRPEDTVARLGGDEFVVLCENAGDQDDVEAVARRVTDAVRVPVRLRGQDVFISASVGVVAARDGSSAEQMLRDADTAMYQAKTAGSGRYTLFDEATRAGISDRLQLSSDLHRALERDELRASYQPLVDLRTGDILGAEALLRWEHPHRGLLSPGAFLGVAEDVGVIVDFDAWILGTACQDTADWRRRLGRPIGVWVNLSGRSLADPALPDTIADALDRSGLEPGSLTLEITEGPLMRDASFTVGTLTALRELGVLLAIDDFGTGYSSLAYLQKFPVQALKVDMTFVAELDAVPGKADSNAAIIDAIVTLAAGLNLRTIAEGIETRGQLAAVTALGCDIGQGFLLGRPTAREDIGEPPPALTGR
jgi:diguanylate cyclase (GGDEF)-like protein/PAS domain S-box-containing protein